MTKKRYLPVKRVQEGELKFNGVYHLTRKGLEYLEFCWISPDEVRNYIAGKENQTLIVNTKSVITNKANRYVVAPEFNETINQTTFFISFI